MLFGKRRFRSLVSFRSLLELGFGAFLVLLWPFWGPLDLFGVLRALRGALVLVALFFLALSQT